MEINKFKINFEAIFLIVVFCLFLWLGYGPLSGHMLSHDTLVGYFAADAFQDAGWAEGIKETGNYKYFAPYTSSGFEDAIAWYAPALFHPVVLLSYLSGIEVYDILIFMVYFLAAVAVLVMYFIIRDYSKNIAILSIPLMLYLFFSNFKSAFLYGQWGYTSGCLFMIAAFWAVTKLRQKKSYILLALFISGTVHTHPSELIFIMGFIGLYLIVNFLTKNIEKEAIKKIILAGVISIILSSYFLIVLKLSAAPTFAGLGGGLFKIGQVWTEKTYGYPPVYIRFFGLMLVPIIGGMLISLSKFKKLHGSILVGFFMLFVGFSNYLGGSIGYRAFQNRFFWPIYLSVFFGFCLYFLAGLTTKKWKIMYSIAIGLILLFVLVKLNYEKSSSGSLIDKDRMDGLTWFNENSPKDSRILFFYGDPYGQTSVLWLTKRIPYFIDIEYYINNINENKIKRKYYVIDVGGFLFHKTSFLTSEDYRENYVCKEKPCFPLLPPTGGHGSESDICIYDYYVFDRASRQQQIAQYNMYLASKLLENQNIEIAYSNNIMVILRNKNPGDDCIEEQTIV